MSWLYLWLFLFSSLGYAEGESTNRSALKFTQIGAGYPGGESWHFGGDILVGYKFRANHAINVTGLSYYDFLGDGLESAHRVGLWTDDGQTLLAEALIQGGTVTPILDSFRYAKLEQSVTLRAGQIYIVGGTILREPAPYNSTPTWDPWIWNVGDPEYQEGIEFLSGQLGITPLFRTLTAPIAPVFAIGEPLTGPGLLGASFVTGAVTEVSVKRLRMESLANAGPLDGIGALYPKPDVASLLLSSASASVKGLVADGVTPLLFEVKRTPRGVQPRFRITVETRGGGDVTGGLQPRLRWLQEGAWHAPTPESDYKILAPLHPPPADLGVAEESAFFYLSAIPSDSLELTAFELDCQLVAQEVDLFETPVGAPITVDFKLRKPPIVLVHGYNTAGTWSDEFLGKLYAKRPADFVFKLRYGSRQVGPDQYDNYVNTHGTLPELAVVLSETLQGQIDGLVPHWPDWAMTQYDVVGHSQGGVLLRMLASTRENSGLEMPHVRPGTGTVPAFRSAQNKYRGRFHRIITIGSPHNGTRILSYLIALQKRTTPELFDQFLPANLARHFFPDGLLQTKFDPYGSSILELNDPLGKWVPDPAAPFLLLNTSTSGGPGFDLLGLNDLQVKSVVTPFGSDGVVDRGSQLASPSAPPYSSVDLPLSHAAPAALFGAQGDQTASPEIAEICIDRFDGRRTSEEFPFAPFPSLSALQPRLDLEGKHPQEQIDEAVLDELLHRKANIEPQMPTPPLPILRELAASGSRTIFRFRLIPAEGFPVISGPTWWAETFNEHGASTAGLTLTIDPLDPLVITISLEEGVTGDLMLYGAYQSTGGRTITTRAFRAASVPPPATLFALELVPDSAQLNLGGEYQPEVWGLYDDGLRRQLRVAAEEATFTSSDSGVAEPASLKVSGRAAGTASVELNYHGAVGSAEVTVVGPSVPVIVLDPQNVDAVYGSNVLLQVAAEAAGSPIEYRWLKDGEVIEGETLAFLRLRHVTAGDSADYVATASNSAGAAVSKPAIVTAHPTGAMLVLEGPSGETLVDGGVFSFGAQTPGGERSCQFTIRNPGVATLKGLAATLADSEAGVFSIEATPVPEIPPGTSTSFTVRFRAGAEGVKTATVQLTNNAGEQTPFVLRLAGTAITSLASSDAFATRVDLGSAASVHLGSDNTGATLDPGEETFGGWATRSVWFQWTAPASGWVTISTAGSKISTLLGLFSGSDSASLQMLGFNAWSGTGADYLSEDYGAAGHPSRLNFYATAGITYQIAVDGMDRFGANGTGTFQFHLSPATPPATLISAVEFAPEPLDVTATEQPLTVNVSLQSRSPLDWEKGTQLHALLFSPNAQAPAAQWQFGITDRVSGDDLAGTYALTATLPRHLASGKWPLLVSVFADDAWTGWSPMGADLLEDYWLLPAAVGGGLSVVNSNPGDTAAPKLVSLTGMPASIDVRSADVTFAVDVTVTDDLSGLAWGQVALNGEYGTFLFETPGPENRIAGNAQNGTYRLKVTIPHGAWSATYYPYFLLRDAAFNTSFYSDNPADFSVPIPPPSEIMKVELVGTVGGTWISFEQPAGLPLTDETSVVDFGTATVDAPVERIFTIRNRGTAPITALEPSFSGTDRVRFSVSSPASLPIAPGARATMTVRFAAIRSEPAIATMHLAHTDYAASPFDVQLLGKGNLPPVLALPEVPPAIEATSPTGAIFNFAVTANDFEDGPLMPTVVAPEGGRFPLGRTVVTCSAVDSHGAIASGSFTVRVVDTTPPVLIPPSDVEVQATSASGAVAGFGPARAGDAVGVVSITYSKGTRTLFPNGTTTVMVTARDAAGNSGTTAFYVRVIPLPPRESWRHTHFGTTQNGGDAADGADPDGDGLINGMELALGTSPRDSTSGQGELKYSGTLAGGGRLVRTGQPQVRIEDGAGGLDSRLLFIRRTDFELAKVSYFVEFSADLSSWTGSAESPAVLADDGTHQVVSVHFPEGKTYARVRVRLED